MSTPISTLTEAEAKAAAEFKNNRARFLFNAAHHKHTMLEVTKVACLMSDLIEELERERDAQRTRADQLMAEAETYHRRLASKGLVSP